MASAAEPVPYAAPAPEVPAARVGLFLAIAFGTTWTLHLAFIVAERSGAPSPDAVLLGLLTLAGLSPTAAALIAARTGSAGGGRTLLRRTLRWRVSPLWYVTALLLPTLVRLLARGIDVALGAPAPPRWFVLPPLGLMTFGPVILGALGEELGWRGFLLPRLARGRSVILASLAVGAIWALWHLMTAFFVPVSISRFPLYAAAVTSTGVIMGWLWARTGGSVAVVIVYHGAMNLPLVDKNYAHGALPPALAAAAIALITLFLPWGRPSSASTKILADAN